MRHDVFASKVTLDARAMRFAGAARRASLSFLSACRPSPRAAESRLRYGEPSPVKDSRRNLILFRTRTSSRIGPRGRSNEDGTRERQPRSGAFRGRTSVRASKLELRRLRSLRQARSARRSVRPARRGARRGVRRMFGVRTVVVSRHPATRLVHGAPHRRTASRPAPVGHREGSGTWHPRVARTAPR